MLNKNTQFCISISHSPSNFGTSIHNAGYAALDLNFIYKAFKVFDLEGAISGVRALGIRGCSVSMPFKEDVVPMLDKLDASAKNVGAVNTIVNQENCLTGYNTDVTGADRALVNINLKTSDRVLLVGAGGVAKAVLAALKKRHVKDIAVTNRNPKKSSDLCKNYPSVELDWFSVENHNFDILINATPIGMEGKPKQLPFNLEKLSDLRAIMDVVVAKENTNLIAYAKNSSKQYVNGNFMSFEQAVAQFELYTGQKAPRKIMHRAMDSAFQV